MDPCRSRFPGGFVFGAATSSYQIEGHSFGTAGSTHWDSFAATPGNVVDSSNGGVACDHYHRFREDFDIAADLGLDAWRFSTSWARVLPDGRGRINRQGLDFYDRLVDELLERRLKPFPTLYHWELPSALADVGGWANPEIADWFGEFADLIGRTIGDRVFAVAPINEPWCIAWLGHMEGVHAPGLRDLRAAARAMHHVPLAHGKAVQALRSNGISNVGTIVNLEHSQAADDSPASIQAASLYDDLYNRWFVCAMREGRYPARALAELEQFLPRGWEQDLATIAAPLDWIGINYYTRKLIAASKETGFPNWSEVQGDLPRTGMGWEIHPAGLRFFLNRIQNEHARGLPIYVTECGMAEVPTRMKSFRDDALRTEFLRLHFDETLHAIADGVDVRGFFIWSMLDNFEWSHGYSQRFGLVHVDFETQARTRKSSCAELRRWLRN